MSCHNCPNVQRCPACDKLLIHKGSRSRHESASCFGQIIHDMTPRVYTWIDVDGLLYRRTTRLLRVVEHKSSGQHRKRAQQEALMVLANIIKHAKTCAGARSDFGLHPASGVFLVEGDPDEGGRLGEMAVTRLIDGRVWRPPTELDALCWPALLKGADREDVRVRLDRRPVPPEDLPPGVSTAREIKDEDIPFIPPPCHAASNGDGMMPWDVI